MYLGLVIRSGKLEVSSNLTKALKEAHSYKAVTQLRLFSEAAIVYSQFGKKFRNGVLNNLQATEGPSQKL